MWPLTLIEKDFESILKAVVTSYGCVCLVQSRRMPRSRDDGDVHQAVPALHREDAHRAHR